MQISKKEVDALNAVVSVTLEPADYQPKCDAALKNYAKKVNLKGFRPGTAPVAMVKKMYGKTILAEEVNKLINDSIYGYLKENNVEILGNPLPSKNNQDNADFDNPGTMEFHFDLGLAPQFNVNLSDISLPYYAIHVDEKMIEQQVDDIKRRHGVLNNTEVATEKDMLMATFNELKEDNQIKEGGIFHSSTVAIEYITDEASKKMLIGLKPGDKVIVDPRKISHNTADMAAMLGIDNTAAEQINSLFQLSVNEIRSLQPAELNQELFDKLYGPGTVTTEEEMRQKIAAELSRNFAGDSRNFFHRDARISLINNLNIELPNEFLKRWIIATNEKPIDAHQLEHEFDHYADDLKWQLIENRIIKDRNIKIEREDLLKYTKENLMELYARYNLPMIDDESLTKHAESLLSKKEEVQNAVQRASTRKVIDTIMDNANINRKEVSFEELMDLYKELQVREHANHKHTHEHHHQHA